MRQLVVLLIIFWRVLFFIAPAHATQRVALVIGNADYRNAPHLPNPINDANDVAAAFERLGFSVKLIKDATFDTMRRSLLDFAQQSQTADIAIVYFAGHGMEIRNENWLVPVDAELRMDVSAGQEAIALGSILPIVSRARALGLIILDACRNNPFSNQLQMSQPGRALSRGLVSVEPPNSVLVVFAAKHGTTADDGWERNSPFTTALLHNLEIPGLEINYLFRNVHDEVFDATQHRQEPYVYGTLSRVQIYLKPPIDASKTQDLTPRLTNEPGVNFVATAAPMPANVGSMVAAARPASGSQSNIVPVAAKELPAQQEKPTVGDPKSPEVAYISPVQTAPRLPSEQNGTPEHGLAIYDGTWATSASGGCPHVSKGYVTIHNGVISGGEGSGRISTDGRVSGEFATMGLLHGRFWGRMTSSTSGVGSWRNDIGCTGNWTIRR
jgi:hypothetical protein